MSEAYLDEARRWEQRAAENCAKADLYKDEFRRRAMLGLARHAEQLAERAVALAEKPSMQSSDGLHPYRAGLFFILREQHNERRTSRQARGSMLADDIGAIAKWPMVRMLAHQFNKPARAVARDLADTYRALEDGSPAP